MSARRGTVTGPSRWLPSPLDELARAAWDTGSFHGRRLARVVPLAVAQGASWAVDRAQRPSLPGFRARTPDGAMVEYRGHDVVLRGKLLAALGGVVDVDLATPGGADGGEVPAASVVEIPLLAARAHAERGAFILPRWIELEIDLSRPEHELWGRRRLETVRRVEREAYAVELTQELDRARHFYDALFVPTALVRHGDGAVVRRFRYVSAAVARGRLLLVSRGGSPLAGLVLVPRLGDAHAWDAWLFGVLGGDYEGTGVAREAAYLHAVRWARDGAGAARLGITTAPPLLADGLARYKLAWGAAASPGLRNGTALALTLRETTPALLAALERARPLCLDLAGPHPALVALDVASAAEPRAVPPGVRPLHVPAGADATTTLRAAARRLGTR